MLFREIIAVYSRPIKSREMSCGSREGIPEGGVIAPHILNLGTEEGSVISFTSRSLY
jgi:hypothetical protein